jgi:hypothetical protein
MLYNTFAMFMMVLSVVGILHMASTGSYTYAIFPVSSFIWGLYTLFKEDDDEYCRRNNINTDIDSGWLFWEEDYNNNPYTRNTNPRSRYNYKNPEYKKILPRCKKNSIVTTDKIKLNNEQQS